MAKVRSSGDHGAKVFCPPARFESIVVFAPSVQALDVMQVVMTEFIERSGIELRDWWAGERTAEMDRIPGSPTVFHMAALEAQTVTFVSLRCNTQDASGFYSARIVVEEGRAGGDGYGYTDCVSLTLSSADLSGDRSEERTRLLIDRWVELIGGLITHFPVWRAHIYRQARSYAPEPPYFYSHHCLYIAHREDITKAYDDPEVYWRSWDGVEPLDDSRVLLTKGLGLYDEMAFKREIYPRTWELARQARPKLTRYFGQEATAPHDKAYFNEGVSKLTLASYDQQAQRAEYAASVAPGEHLLPRDIYSLDDLRYEKKLGPGQPLKEVRVTFENREAAEREKRPVLDVGCRVLYRDEQGELRELTE